MENNLYRKVSSQLFLLSIIAVLFVNHSLALGDEDDPRYIHKNGAIVTCTSSCQKIQNPWRCAYQSKCETQQIAGINCVKATWCSNFSGYKNLDCINESQKTLCGDVTDKILACYDPTHNISGIYGISGITECASGGTWLHVGNESSHHGEPSQTHLQATGGFPHVEFPIDGQYRARVPGIMDCEFTLRSQSETTTGDVQWTHIYIQLTSGSGECSELKSGQFDFPFDSKTPPSIGYHSGPNKYSGWFMALKSNSAIRLLKNRRYVKVANPEFPRLEVLLEKQ